MESILLDKVIEIIDSGVPFDIEFVTLDKERNKGGRLYTIPKALRYRSQRLTRGTSVKPEQKETRNIYDPQKRSVVRVHLYLITLFNGKVVS